MSAWYSINGGFPVRRCQEVNAIVAKIRACCDRDFAVNLVPSGGEVDEFSIDGVGEFAAAGDITRGGPVGALVFARNAVAGDIWTREGRFRLDHMTVIGPRIRTIYPEPARCSPGSDPIYDRHYLTLSPTACLPCGTSISTPM